MSRRLKFVGGLKDHRPALGVFQKTPSHQVTELLGLAGVDFVVLDTEHAPFDPSQLDVCLMAAGAADLPVLVRVSSNAPEPILAALDMGATGILVPHVASTEDARNAVRAARYKGGERGFSPSTRAGGYGSRGLDSYMTAADCETAVLLQIEDAPALDVLDEIAATPGVAGLFVGRADLAVSMGLDWNAPELDGATIRVADIARRAGLSAGAYLPDTKRLAEFRSWGITFFIVGSDQGALKGAVQATVAAGKVSAEEPA